MKKIWTILCFSILFITPPLCAKLPKHVENAYKEKIQQAKYLVKNIYIQVGAPSKYFDVSLYGYPPDKYAALGNTPTNAVNTAKELAPYQAYYEDLYKLATTDLISFTDSQGAKQTLNITEVSFYIKSPQIPISVNSQAPDNFIFFDLQQSNGIVSYIKKFATAKNAKGDKIKVSVFFTSDPFTFKTANGNNVITGSIHPKLDDTNLYSLVTNSPPSYGPSGGEFSDLDVKMEWVRLANTASGESIYSVHFDPEPSDKSLFGKNALQDHYRVILNYADLYLYEHGLRTTQSKNIGLGTTFGISAKPMTFTCLSEYPIPAPVDDWYPKGCDPNSEICSKWSTLFTGQNFYLTQAPKWQAPPWRPNTTYPLVDRVYIQNYECAIKDFYQKQNTEEATAQNMIELLCGEPTKVINGQVTLSASSTIPRVIVTGTPDQFSNIPSADVGSLSKTNPLRVRVNPATQLHNSYTSGWAIHQFADRSQGQIVSLIDKLSATQLTLDQEINIPGKGPSNTGTTSLSYTPYLIDWTNIYPIGNNQTSIPEGISWMFSFEEPFFSNSSWVQKKDLYTLTGAQLQEALKNRYVELQSILKTMQSFQYQVGKYGILKSGPGQSDYLINKPVNISIYSASQFMATFGDAIENELHLGIQHSYSAINFTCTQ
jgi:hypothetical protein